MKLNEKISKLTREDRLEYYIRFQDTPSLNINTGTILTLFSISTLYILAIYILFLQSGLMITLELEEQIQSLLILLFIFLKVMCVLILTDVILSLLNFYKFYKDRRLFFNERIKYTRENLKW